MSETGRPTKYDPAFCEIAKTFLEGRENGKGKSKIQLCRHLRIAKSTMQLWEKIHPAFSVAIEEGLTYAEARWHDLAEENIDNKDFSCRMYELQMMNRYGWSRKVEQNIDASLKQEESIKDLE